MIATANDVCNQCQHDVQSMLDPFTAVTGVRIPLGDASYIRAIEWLCLHS